MTAAPQYPVLSIDEYFELEALSNVRHEYDNGLAYAMAGTSEAHVLITTNLVMTLGQQTADTIAWRIKVICRLVLWAKKPVFILILRLCGEERIEHHNGQGFSIQW